MQKQQEILVMKNGDTFPIRKKDGKYIYVKGTQFRRSNPNILEIKKAPKEERKSFGAEDLPKEETEKD